MIDVEDKVEVEADVDEVEGSGIYHFTIEISGAGDDLQSAWLDALRELEPSLDPFRPWSTISDYKFEKKEDGRNSERAEKVILTDTDRR